MTRREELADGRPKRAIAARVRRPGGHYVLAVKVDQPTLHAPFDSARGEVVARTDDLILSHAKRTPGTRVGHAESSADTDNHGRVGTRRTWVGDEARWLGAELLCLCPGFSAVVAVACTRQDPSDLTGEVTVARRYFTTGHGGVDAAFLGYAVGSRWRLDFARGRGGTARPGAWTRR